MRNLRLLLLFTIGFLLSSTQFVNAQEEKEKKVEQEQQSQIEEEVEEVEVEKTVVVEDFKKIKQKPAETKEKSEPKYIEGEGKKVEEKLDDDDDDDNDNN